MNFIFTDHGGIEDMPGYANMTARRRRKLMRRANKLQKWAENKKEWDVSGNCRMQLVETVPQTLKAHDFAEDLPMEHISTQEVFFISSFHSYIGIFFQIVQIGLDKAS